VPGLFIRLSARGAACWSLLLRVSGEGPVNRHGRRLLGKKIRLTLGYYPSVSLQTARLKAMTLIAQAKRGINPKHSPDLFVSSALTVRALSEEFLESHVHSRALDSANNYEISFAVHINPQLGERLADALTRQEVRMVMDHARVKRDRADGKPGSQVGGVEAARSAMSALRHMYFWAIDEGKLERSDNPVIRVTENLPRKNQRDRVLSITECRLVWEAAKDTGYPFGTHVQLMMLTGCRRDEWASARVEWLDLIEALIVIPRASYKSDHVHIVPLVPQAVQILRDIVTRSKGGYLLSSNAGKTPIRGIAKFYKTRLEDAIVAIAGEPLTKSITSHDLRRTVATRLAEIVGEAGDKVVKRVLGHADGTVTALYNRYAYVREMRSALERWARDLTASEDMAASVPRLKIC
jgi:integrase